MTYLYVQVWLPIFAVFTGACALTNGFIREPINQTVRAGETVTLHCTVSAPNRPYRFVYWYKSFGFSDNPSMPISSQRSINENADSRYSIVGSGSQYNLQIREVKVGDTSYYKCKYYNGNFADSQIARLSVYDDSLTPRCHYQPLNADVGSLVSISCFLGSSASINSLSLWRGVNGHKITNLDRQSDGSIIYRFHLRANDNNRTYTCNYGRTYTDIHNCSVTPLNITPTISLTPDVNYGVPDGEIRFSCRATGLPVYSSYRWLVGTGHSTHRISNSTGRYILSNNGDSARLTIMRLQLSDNNVAIRCVAVNDLGQRQVTLGKMIVQSFRNIPTDVMRTVGHTSLQSTRGSPVDGVFPPDTPTVTERGEKVILKTPSLGEDMHSETTKQKDSKPTNKIIPVKTSSNKRPSIMLPIVLTLLFLFIIVIIFLFILIKKTGKIPPELLKRFSLSKPAVLNRISLCRPQCLEPLMLSWQGAKKRVESLQKWANLGGRTTANEDKRQSLRDQIEVVVNPPPPEWKLKVEDFDQAQRQRLLGHHAPIGGYSAKEKDLLTSLVTGTIQMKTLDRVIGIDLSPTSHDDVDNQLGYDFKEEDSADGISKPEQETDHRQCESVTKDCELPKMATIVRNDTDVSRSETDNEAQDEPTGPALVYANTSVAMGKINDHEESVQVDDAIAEVKYAELDLKLTGPWDENDIIKTDAKTAYAVIDHTKRKPVVRSTCHVEI